MGLFDGFSKHAGGARGGLMAVGEMLSAMAMETASGPPGESTGQALGRALAVSGPTLGAGFKKGREAAADREFMQMAKERAAEAPEGSRERSLWEAVGSGKGGDRMAKLLPSLWNAQAADRNAAGGSITPQQLKDMRKAQAARQKLIENPGLLGKIDLSNPQNLQTWGMTPFPGQIPDPDFERFFSWASESQLRSGGQPVPFSQWGALPDGTFGALPVTPQTVDNDATAALQSPAEETGPGLLQRGYDAVMGLFGGGEAEAAADPFEAELAELLGVTAEPGAPISTDPALAGGGALMSTEPASTATSSPLLRSEDRPRNRRDLRAREEELRSTPAPETFSGRFSNELESIGVAPAARGLYGALESGYTSASGFLDSFRDAGTARVDARGAGRAARSQLMQSLEPLEQWRRRENEKFRWMRGGPARAGHAN